jgi:hypothetical protein
VRADKAKAEQYFRAGAQAFKQQSFAAAAAQFELAYKELELPEIAFSAAQAYRRQYFIEPKPEYVQRAVELYRIYLDQVKTGGRVADASDGLAEMKRELERLTAAGAKVEQVRVAQTRLAVSVVVGEPQAGVAELSAMPAAENTGAKVTLDGKPIELFVPVEVEPGQHAVEVTAPGFFPVSERRRVVEGSTELVEVKLTPQPAHVSVQTDAGAQLAIDGRPVGTAPLAAAQLVAGKHLFEIVARGREPVVRELDLARGETRTLDVPLVKTAKRRAVPWILGASGGLVVLTGVAATLAVISDGKMSDLEHERVTKGISQSQRDDYSTWVHRRDEARDAAWVLGGGALAVGALAAGLYWFDVPRPSEHTAVVPAVTGGAPAIAVLGRF